MKISNNNNNDNTLKDNFMSGLNTIILNKNHNKTPSNKNTGNQLNFNNNNTNPIQIPFETSLGNDFLSLFANSNTDTLPIQKKNSLNKK